VFIGYPCGQNGLRVYDVENGDIFVSGDIMFCEEFFPFSENPKDEVSPNKPECVEHENFFDLGINNQNQAHVLAVIRHPELDILDQMHAGLQGQCSMRGSYPAALPGAAAATSGPGAFPGPAAL